MKLYSHEPPGYDCPFCAVIAGQDYPPWVLQQDVVLRAERATAWINGRWWQNNPGHVVVVPNDHVENLYTLTGRGASEIHEMARQVALAMKVAYRCDGISTRQHNEPAGYQEVWHFHLHVFPRFAGDDLYGSPYWHPRPEERLPYAQRLRAALQAVPVSADVDSTPNEPVT
jgi:histidine triad (HIT) family protein